MLLSLNPIVPAYPQFAYDSTGQVNYSPATEAFSLTATPLSFTTTTTSSPLRVSGTRSVAIQMHVDNAGDLVVMPGDGLTVNGAVTVNGHAYSGTLLTGSIADFGFTNDTSGDTPPNTDTDAYYFSFQPTGGSMVALFGSGDIGFQASSEHSTFAGSFQTSFTGGAKGTIGPIGAPSITTVSGGTVVVGSGTPLTDSATLSGGQGPTGTITFQLTGPGNTVVDTETVAVNGNGTYNTPTGYLPTAVGTYQWVASYSGDASNVTVSSAYGAEPEIVSPASAAFSTTPGMTSMTLGASSVPLTDWAVLAGDYNPTGSITFTLVTPNGSTVDSETVTVNGNGTYATPTGYTLPTTGTVTGTYQWNATYSGDTNNVSVSDNNNPNEQVTVNQGLSSVSTAIDNAATGMPISGDQLLGTAVYDMAMVIGSPIAPTPTGTVTYYFYNTASPVYGTTVPVNTQTVDLNADGSVASLLATAALTAGSYAYVGVYSGDGNYTGSVGAVEPLTVSQGSSSVGTAIDNAATGAPTSGNQPLGTAVYDTASITGAPFTPAGTVTYYFYNTASPVYGTTVPVSSETVTLNADGSVPNSAVTAALTAGSYAYVGVYSGDGNYTGYVGAVEPLTVSHGSSSVSTGIDNVATGAAISGNQPLGTAVYDTATVAGAPFTPTGTVTYYFYNTASPVYGSTTPVSSETVTLGADGSVASSAATAALTAGSYAYVGVYSGDGNYTGYVGAVEPLTISQSSSSVGTAIDNAATGAAISGDQPLGTSVYDTATVTGGAFAPTGTVTYYFYNTASPVYGTTVPVSTQTVTLSSGAVPNSAVTAALAAGSYAYVTVYSGDGNYTGSVGAVEPLAVAKGSSSVSTAIDNAATGAVISGSQPLGTSVYDTATVMGAPFTPAGTVTYYFHNTASPVYGTTTPVSTQTVTLSGGVVPNSTTTAALAAGSYAYVAVYTGDANYTGYVGAVEPLAVAKGSSSVGTAIDNAATGAPISGNQPLGTSVYDTATVMGAPFTPAGTVTYYFYNTASPVYGTTTPVSTQTVTLSSGAVPNSATTAALVAGSYAYIAVYSGDGNYAGAVGAVEPLTITYPGGVPPRGTVSTVIDKAATGTPISGGQPLGTSVYDTATVTGIQYAPTPTGTVTYCFYNTATPVYGTTTPVSTQTVTLSSGVVPNSAATVALAAGSYAYIAVYNGDSTYTGGVGPVEPLTISQGSSSVSTAIDNAATGKSICGSQALGTSVYDTATVTGTPFMPTGTVTYYFYNTASPVYGSTTPVSTQTVTLSNGAVPNSAATAALAAGSYAYIGVYNGDGNYTGSVGAVEPLTVNPACGAPNVTVTKT